MGNATLDPTGLILACPSCAQKNRVAFGQLGDQTRCGRCKTSIGPPSQPIDVPSVASFDALIRDAKLPIVVDFWAEWCGPCRMMAPELARVAAAQAGRVVVAKVDTEALPDLAARYQVRSIPCSRCSWRAASPGARRGRGPRPRSSASCWTLLRLTPDGRPPVCGRGV